MASRFKKYLSFDGKIYQVYGKTEEEAIINRERKRQELESQMHYQGGNQKLSAWAKVCVDTYKPNLDGKTLKTYWTMMNNGILNHIGHMPIKKVTPIICQRILNLRSNGSSYYIRRVNNMLNFLFDKAVDNGYIVKNPAHGLVLPKGNYNPRRSLTEEEIALFFQAVKNHDKQLYFLLIYYCGCRPEEAAQTRWSDIYQDSGYWYLHIRGTKTVNADRVVPIPNEFYDAYLDFHNKSGLICPTLKGTMMDEQSRKRAWHSLVREMNMLAGCKIYRNQLIPPLKISKDLVTYCLRHTYCTNLAKQGVDIRTAQALMGHADITITANIYTHVDKKLIENAARIISSHSANSKSDYKSD